MPFLSLFLLLFLSFTAFGESNKIHSLRDVVVTPTRSEQSPDALAFQTEVRDGWDLQVRRQVRSTPEALRERPSVMVQKTAHGQGSPFLRGWTGFRTLMMVDGVRLNNSVYRDGPNPYWNTVDPYSLERLEVMMGSGSVQYGSDAIGGVVQGLTPDPLARRDDPMVGASSYAARPQKIPGLDG